MATYYVAPSGSDTSSGTLSQPFGSLQYAHNKALPGDTIYLRGGTYKPTSSIYLTHDGASGKPITVSSYPGEKAILDGSLHSNVVVRMSGVSWNHFDNIEIRNGGEAGLILDSASHNNRIEELNIHHNGRTSQWGGTGLYLSGSSANNLLLNNDSHHNRDLQGDNADGFVVNSSGTGNVLRGNRAWNNSDDGFDLFNGQNGTTAGPVLLEGNWAFLNGFGQNGEPVGEGNGFKLGGTRSGTGTTSGGHTLVDNVAWDNRTSGFVENGASKPLILKGNIAYDHPNYNFLFSNPAHTLTDNLSFGTGRVVASGTAQGNSWNSDATISAADFDPVADAVRAGPRQADGSLPVFRARSKK
jgi:Right handed beta helix region